MARAEATVPEATTPVLAICDTPADFVPSQAPTPSSLEQLLEENKKLKEQLAEFEKARVKEETDKKEKKGKKNKKTKEEKKEKKQEELEKTRVKEETEKKEKK